MNWKVIAGESPYRTAVAVDEALRLGNSGDAQLGLQELIEALGRSDKRALKSHPVRLMAHIIKWQVQPAHRSRSWAGTIANARDEIADIQEDTPSLTRAVLEGLWDKCFQAAHREAEGETGQAIELSTLSWADVFEREYAIG